MRKTSCKPLHAGQVLREFAKCFKDKKLRARYPYAMIYDDTIIATDSWGNSATQTKTIVVTAADGDTGSDTDSGAEGGDAPAEGLPGWAIALIVVGGVVVVAAGVTAGVLISKKKAAADDEDSDAQ